MCNECQAGRCLSCNKSRRALGYPQAPLLILQTADCAALALALCLAAMQLRTYLELAGLSLPQMLEKLAAVAQPGELSEGFGISAISRHSRGLLFPTPILQELYSRATDSAVQPQDWVKLALEKRAQQGETV